MSRRPPKVSKGFRARLKAAQTQEQAAAIAERLHGRSYFLIGLIVAVLLVAGAALGAQGELAKFLGNGPLKLPGLQLPPSLAEIEPATAVLIGIWIVAGLIVFVCGLMQWSTHRKLILARQNQADRLAADIFAALRTGQAPRPFVFYLQPQSATAGAKSRPSGRNPMADLERGIERSAWQVGPVISLGEPLEHIGAGRIKVAEGEWQAATQMLAQGADLIVLAPSQELGPNGDLKRKAVFVEPPTHQDKGRFLYFGDGQSPKVTASFSRLDFNQLFHFFEMVRKAQLAETGMETHAAPAPQDEPQSKGAVLFWKARPARAS